CVPTTGEIAQNLAIHGDFIKDVAYSVDDLETCLALIEKNGGKIIKQSKMIKDEFGSVKKAKIAGPTGNLVHTLVQNVDYAGIFLPGFKPAENFKLPGKLGRLPINSLDHVVENYPENMSDEISDWYAKMLKLNRFWSIDDVQVHTEYSALKAQIVSNSDNSVQVTIIEPVSNYLERRGQVQEFLDFHGGPGIQHIAFKVSDIVKTVDEMRERGVEFLDIPDTYYDQLEARLTSANMRIEENLKDVRKLKLL
uniref:VOC domain-containing protein n=1 Tax=Panagrolaimus sp. JU765 TaxID=591449 RepID=A0AC34RR05_9BILA